MSLSVLNDDLGAELVTKIILIVERYPWVVV